MMTLLVMRVPGVKKILLDTAERAGIKPIIVKGKNVVRSHITQDINSKS